MWDLEQMKPLSSLWERAAPALGGWSGGAEAVAEAKPAWMGRAAGATAATATPFLELFDGAPLQAGIGLPPPGPPGRQNPEHQPPPDKQPQQQPQKEPEKPKKIDPDRDGDGYEKKKPEPFKKYQRQNLFDLLLGLGLAVGTVFVVLAALADPEPLTKLALAGLSAVMIAQVMAVVNGSDEGAAAPTDA